MISVSIQIGKFLKYESVGTVEFIVVSFFFFCFSFLNDSDDIIVFVVNLTFKNTCGDRHTKRDHLMID